jgi:glycosyltransferase involved in cell wall biosynthesis
MKILIVNKYDKEGGAAIAAYRLHKSLLEVGVQSSMLVQKKITDDYTVVGSVTIKQKLISAINYHVDQLPVFFYKNKSADLFSPSWFSFGDILKQINAIQPDIVHLHWICKGMLTIEDLAKIKVPIVWTLHDSWAFTGGCHIIRSCDKYLNVCEACPELMSNKPKDLSKKVFERKRKAYSKINKMTVVTVSKWLESCARNSTLLKDKEIITIPNCINTTAYKPLDKLLAKSILNINKSKKVILFGAMSAVDDKNKGYSELLEAINKLKLKTDEVELIVFGSAQPKKPPPLKYKVSFLGRFFDDISLQIIYSAADVMVVPSRQESFGQTASESMSCGTPVVAFGTSGLVDIVEHKVNGYLAKPYDTIDLANGIEWVLGHVNYKELAENAREKVVRKFDSKIVSDAYVSLYQSMLSNN